MCWPRYAHGKRHFRGEILGHIIQTCRTSIFLTLFANGSSDVASGYQYHYCSNCILIGGSVAEWLARWTQAQKGRVQIAIAMLSGNDYRQTVHNHCASVRQAAKLVAALLRVARVTAGLAESNGSLPPGL